MCHPQLTKSVHRMHSLSAGPGSRINTLRCKPQHTCIDYTTLLASTQHRLQSWSETLKVQQNGPIFKMDILAHFSYGNGNNCPMQFFHLVKSALLKYLWPCTQAQIGPLMPLFGNHSVMHCSCFLCWHSLPSSAIQAFVVSGIKPINALLNPDTPCPERWLHFFQQGLFLSNCARLGSLSRNLKPIEALCLNDPDSLHTIALVYNILLLGAFPQCPFYT